MEIASKTRLASRLKYCLTSKQKISFLVGSAVSTVTGQPSRGVPNVDEMIQSIIPLFDDPSERQELEIAISSASPSVKYQAAMKFFIESRGQASLNELVRRSVLKARQNSSVAGSEEDFEKDIDGWFLAPGVEAIGKLAAHFPQSFTSPLLTTNFDPLLEIAIRRAGRDASSVVVPADGNFFYGGIGGLGAQVVHLHGFWRTGDMLHTPAQLTRNRPSLKGALRTLLRESTLVVAAYGGWEDVFTKTLIEVISEGSDALDVLWCCYESDHAAVIQKNRKLFETCENLLGQRLIVYSGIDCHEFFPELVHSLNISDKILNRSPEVAASNVNLLPNSVPPPERPIWVGRNTEVSSLDRHNAGVVCICGFGGVGKSALAAKMLERKLEAGGYSHWAWVDCRELDHTIGSHFVDLVSAISDGVRPVQVADQEIVDLIVDFLSINKSIIVFDNVDAYVDLESGEFIGVLKMLIDSCLDRSIMSQIVLTCRPAIEHSNGNLLGIHLSGLSKNEISDLFKLRFEGKFSISAEQVDIILDATSGNALYVNLLSTQVLEGLTTFEVICDRLKKYGSANIKFSVLEEIWRSLNEKQKTVLRYLCESPGPQLQDRLEIFAGNSMSPNRMRRVVRSLVKMDVVVERVRSGTVYLEMHPLVRSFIREKYSSEERRPFITRIIHICDLMIRKFRPRLDSNPDGIYDYWVSKIELSIDRDDSAKAVETLKEVLSPLINSGRIEEFIRLGCLIGDKFGFNVDEAAKKTWDEVLKEMVEFLAYLGREGEVNYWISKLKESVQGKSARYVLLKEITAKAEWILGRNEEAGTHAREGVELKVKSDVDTDFECNHILALSLRDSGNFSEALSIFLSGHILEQVISDSELDEASHFFGNIGRTLQLRGDLDDARILLRRSAKMLLEERGNLAEVNRGWAAFWLAQILTEKHDNETAFYAAVAAAESWKLCYPRKSKEAEIMASRLREQISSDEIIPNSRREVVALYDSWISSAE